MPPKITNMFGLPDAIVEAVKRDDYSREGADFSVSDLYRPPLLRKLEIDHRHEIVEDVVERLWALFGTAVHKVLEQAGVTGDAIEERLFATVTLDGESYVIGGKPDSVKLEDRVLEDWKNTSVWSAIDGIKPEWEIQANLYRWLLNINGVEVDELTIVTFYKDWRKNERRRYGWYPSTPVKVHEVPVWSLDECYEFVINAIRERLVSEPRDCTDEERWKKDSKWALMKEGRKSAVKVEDSEKDIWDYANSNDIAMRDPDDTRFPLILKPKYEIVERPGAYIRCEDGPYPDDFPEMTYCPVSAWCPVLHPEFRTETTI